MERAVQRFKTTMVFDMIEHAVLCQLHSGCSAGNPWRSWGVAKW